MWQEISVYIIGILTLIYMGVKIRKFILLLQDKEESPCGNCKMCDLSKETKKL